MSNDELANLQPQQAGELARRMASISQEHALAILDGTAVAVVKTDPKHTREMQAMGGEQIAFGTRLLDAIGMFRSIVKRRVVHNHKVENTEAQMG